MRKKLELVEKVLLQMKTNLKKNLIGFLLDDYIHTAMICAEDLDLNRKALSDVEDSKEIIKDEESVWEFFREDPLRYIAVDVYADQLGGNENTFYEVNEENDNICTKKEVKEILKELKEIYDKK